MKKRNLNDWAVALSVIACSIVLFGALALALSGKMLGKPARTLRVNFRDITGVTLGSQVRYAGANAGEIYAVRMLTPEERKATGDPLDAVQVTLSLTKNVPPLPSDVKVSIAADTLLSDKFILIMDGSPSAPALADNAVLQGISPTTFDKLSRDVDDAVESLRKMMGGTQKGTGDIFDRLRALLDNTDGLITEARGVVGDARTLVAEARPAVQDVRVLTGDARQLIGENKEKISRTIDGLARATSLLEQLADRGNALLANNDRKLTSTIADFKVTAENLKVTSTYAKVLARILAERPSQLIWGGKTPPLPTEKQILQSSKPLGSP